MDACPKCTHPHVVKAGKARGNQRWRCRGCGYQWTRTTPRGRPGWQKSLAVFLYGHGVSMNAVGKMFGVRAAMDPALCHRARGQTGTRWEGHRPRRR